MSTRLETGIDALDRKLNGGLPAGSLVMLAASPASQSEQVIRDIATTRKTLLVTTRRPRKSIERSLDDRGIPPDNVAVRAADPDEPSSFMQYARALENNTNLVLDPMDPLETLPEREYVEFLSQLKQEVLETESVGIMHCLTGDGPDRNRSVTEHIADVVFELSTDVSGDAIENRLLVPKFRNGTPFKEVLKLELQDTVAVDTSRDIG